MDTERKRLLARGLYIGIALVLVAVSGIIYLRTFVRHRQPRLTAVTSVPAHPKARLHHIRVVPSTMDFSVPVLMYHHIGTPSGKYAHSRLLRDLTVSTENFQRQMKFLQDNGFIFVSTSRIESAVRHGTPLPCKAVAVTIDDGYEDAFSEALPILHKYGIPATVFMVATSVGIPQHLTKENLAAMIKDGIIIESHSLHHYDLAVLPTSQLDYELSESKRVMEQKYHIPMDSLAYPAGAYNSGVIAAAQNAGYRAAWLKDGGPVHPGANIYKLPRLRVSGSMTITEFARMIRTASRCDTSLASANFRAADASPRNSSKVVLRSPQVLHNSLAQRGRFA